MSAPRIRSRIAGHSSPPPSSEVTPGRTSWSTTRIVETSTPSASRASPTTLARRSVLDSWGDGFRVQFRNSARITGAVPRARLPLPLAVERAPGELGDALATAGRDVEAGGVAEHGVGDAGGRGQLVAGQAGPGGRKVAAGGGPARPPPPPPPAPAARLPVPDVERRR